MSAQLYNVGDNVELNGQQFVVVDIPSEEGKSGTYFSYVLRLKAEVDEAAQFAADMAAKGKAVAADQTEKLTPTQTSDPEA